MVEASFPFLLSTALLAEFREVLLRPKIRSRHGLDANAIDSLLTKITANAIVREPDPSAHKAPTSQDQHLWDLLATEHGTALITGDQDLLTSPPRGASVISPSSFIR
jgi:putative PIN family toxin of toxin-antitoxin system